jgi:hypothetical protein
VINNASIGERDERGEEEEINEEKRREGNRGRRPAEMIIGADIIWG